MAANPADINARLASLEQFRPRMLRVARRYAPCPHDAQDAVQEAMLRVAAVDDLDWERVEGLLVRAARNICIDQLRAGQRRRSRDDRYARAAGSTHDSGAEDICDRAEAAWFRQKLGALVPQERRILERLADGQPLIEIARSEGISYKAAHSSLSRARKVLVTMWQATLSIFALGWAKRRAGTFSALGAAATAGLAVAVTPFLLAPNAPLPAKPSAPVTSLQTKNEAVRTSVARVQRLPMSPARSKLVSEATPGQVRHRHPVDPGTPIGVTRSNDDESLTQTLARCLHDGLALNPEIVGCPS